MPYTKPEWRELALQQGDYPRAGDLAFMLAYVVETYRRQHGDSYQTHAEIRAGLATVTDEFYARVQKPYETQKLRENGPVFAAVPLKQGSKLAEEAKPVNTGDGRGCCDGSCGLPRYMKEDV